MTAQEIRELDTEALLAKVEEYKKRAFWIKIPTSYRTIRKHFTY